MNSTEIRQSFLDFFAAKGHRIVPSASLLPGSPNLLFTNAGMNPFVPYFLGERSAPHPRVADTQKCIRAGGKHNDLEDVGFDTYHHTLFEMLGNWSFGDYFKEEAITWAWELLTQVWGFPKERLYATVYQPADGEPASFDQEAYALWEKLFQAEGLDPKVHLLTCGKQDNFWMMGETGPCGPCSEIHVDLTPRGDSGGRLVNRDSPFCIEIWNLVFIQFNADEQGDFTPLSARHVDTGMGFERVAGILAGTDHFKDFSRPPSNYASDLFTDLFAHLSACSGHHYQGTLPENREDLNDVERRDCAFRILADHIRTLSCSIADGILPGNEGRNYVLRRILRRAVLWSRRIDLPDGAFADLAGPVIDKLGPVFPELKAQQTVIRKVLLNEEAAFARTLDRGLQLFDKIAAAGSGVIAGEEAFTLYDTYGFPLDLTELIARERGLRVNSEGFEQAMDKQRRRARAAQKKVVVKINENPADADAAATDFVGYELQGQAGLETRLGAVIPDAKGAFLVLDQTPFYAGMGGQVGDTGYAEINGRRLPILDTIKDESQRHLHQVNAPSADLNSLVGQSVTLHLDWERRRAIQCHHTATHILHWALRRVLGSHVHQAGSYVDAERLRFDFSHYEGVTPEQWQELELLANQRLLENTAVRAYQTPFDKKPENCQAFFGEKYGDIVRVIDIGSWSVELCGGTHVQAIGEIGLIKITGESAVAAGIRRIEAEAGASAHRHAFADARLLQALCQTLSCPPKELEARLAALLDQRAVLEKSLRAVQQKQSADQAGQLVDQARQFGDLRVVAAQVAVAQPQQLRPLAVQVARQIGPGIVILGSAFGAKGNILALCSPEAIAAGHQAGDIIRDLCGKLSGKGGGKPDFAMGGIENTGSLEQVLSDYVI